MTQKLLTIPQLRQSLRRTLQVMPRVSHTGIGVIKARMMSRVSLHLMMPRVRQTREIQARLLSQNRIHLIPQLRQSLR